MSLWAPGFKSGAETGIPEHAGVRSIPEFEIGCRDERTRFSCMAAPAPIINLGAEKAIRPVLTSGSSPRSFARYRWRVKSARLQER